ncbi:MAG: (2Fe-2S)-binding protein [Alphaproteobacteria bacterium]|nr:(2Fe-2S)-binding protein [Alphaproteobacteria bacterium]
MRDPVEELDVRLTVNGEHREARIAVRRSLADVLRETFGLTGTHLGCEHGACGACTVLLDGAPVRSCLTLAVQAEGAAVTTVEGLAAGGRLHPLQQAFKSHHALQCGFCTPGFLISAAALLRDSRDPSEAEIREALSGNICRCTGYQFIIDAVRAVAAELRADPAAPRGDRSR